MLAEDLRRTLISVIAVVHATLSALSLALTFYGRFNSQPRSTNTCWRSLALFGDRLEIRISTPFITSWPASERKTAMFTNWRSLTLTGNNRLSANTWEGHLRCDYLQCFISVIIAVMTVNIIKLILKPITIMVLYICYYYYYY